MIGQILLTFITVIVGVNLIPSIVNGARAATCNWNGSDCIAGSNVTGAAAAIMGLVPLFYILGLLLATISSSLTVLAKMDF